MLCAGYPFSVAVGYPFLCEQPLGKPTRTDIGRHELVTHEMTHKMSVHCSWEVVLDITHAALSRGLGAIAQEQDVTVAHLSLSPRHLTPRTLIHTLGRDTVVNIQQQAVIGVGHGGSSVTRNVCVTARKLRNLFSYRKTRKR